MKSSFVAVKVSPTKYKHFKVDENVKTYIQQLEAAIRNDSFEGIRKLYPKLNSKKD